MQHRNNEKNWYKLSKNSNAILLLERNLEKVDWGLLSQNTEAIYILEKNSNKSNKFNFLNPENNNDILKKKLNFYYSEKTGQIFPIVDDIVIFNKNEVYAL